MNYAYAEHHEDCICAICEHARVVALQIITRAMDSADDIIKDRGIPQLVAINDRPLIKPLFTTAISKSRDTWLAENCPALLQWFQATKEYSSDDETWDSYCAEQFYQQQTLDQLTEEWSR